MKTGSRPYSHPDDLPKLTEFLLAVRPPAWLGEYPSVTDLQESMERPTIREKTSLWLNDRNEVIAFAFVLEPYNNLVFETRPDAGADIEEKLIAWGIESADRSMSTLDTSCREDDARRVSLLERHGFTRLEENTLCLACNLKSIIPSPLVPDGFAIRPFAGESEVDLLVELHQAAFGTSNMTREERLAIMHAPDYDPDLDLILVAPGGSLAGYCTCSISSTENKMKGTKVGHTDPVAVHPDFQRRGLARALLLKGSQLLKDRGMEMAMLSTSSNNLAMQRAAETAGFRVYSKKIWFSKTLTNHSPDA